jgi:hypothetical protein
MANKLIFAKGYWMNNNNSFVNKQNQKGIINDPFYWAFIFSYLEIHAFQGYYRLVYIALPHRLRGNNLYHNL